MIDRAIAAVLLVAACVPASDPTNPEPLPVQADPMADCDPVHSMAPAEIGGRLWLRVGSTLLDFYTWARPVSVLSASELDGIDTIGTDSLGRWLVLVTRKPAKIRVIDWGEDAPTLELVDRSSDGGDGELHASLAGGAEAPTLAVWIRRSSPTPVNVGPVHNWADARTAPRSGIPTLADNGRWLAIADHEGISVHSVGPTGMGEGAILPCPIDPADSPSDATPAYALANDGVLGCLLGTRDSMELVLFAPDGTRTALPVAAGARGVAALAQPWAPEDLRWLVSGDEPAIELLGTRQRQRIELSTVPRRTVALAPEMIAWIDEANDFGLVRRDGAQLRMGICRDPQFETLGGRWVASWYANVAADACGVGEPRQLFPRFAGGEHCD